MLELAEVPATPSTTYTKHHWPWLFKRTTSMIPRYSTPGPKRREKTNIASPLLQRFGIAPATSKKPLYFDLVRKSVTVITIIIPPNKFSQKIPCICFCGLHLFLKAIKPTSFGFVRPLQPLAKWELARGGLQLTTPLWLFYIPDVKTPIKRESIFSALLTLHQPGWSRSWVLSSSALWAFSALCVFKRSASASASRWLVNRALNRNWTHPNPRGKALDAVLKSKKSIWVWLNTLRPNR